MGSRQALYAPLREKGFFRLIVLEPGVADDPIRVHLRECEIGSAPAYDAISYVWGDPGQTVQIFCNGHPKHITRNLHWALTRARRPAEPRFLWADALCINQEDTDERSHQVAQMGHIYANARLVLACIGEDEDGGSKALASLLDDLNSIARRGPLQEIEKLSEDYRWDAVRTFLSMPWFSRLWVLQEVGLAREPLILYGRAEFSYRGLLTAIKFSEIFAKFNRRLPLLRIHREWSDWASTEEQSTAFSQYTLLDLFDHAALLSCKDPRDRVYALLAHPLCSCGALSVNFIEPDYRKPPLAVFQEVTELLLRTIDLRALSSVEHDLNTISQDAPSWVIRWDTGCTMNNICDRPGRFHASEGDSFWHSSSSFCPQDGRLNLEGVFVGRVQMAFKIRLDPPNWLLKFESEKYGILSLEDLIEGLERDRTPSVYGTQRIDALGLTLLARYHANEDPAKISQVLDTFDAYCNWRRIGSAASSRAADYWNNTSLVCGGRALIFTEDGYYGLAPWITEPGDVCCVLLGSDVPFVFRTNETRLDEGALKLVGECYLHGFMNGEALKFMRNGVVKKTLIRIY